MIHTALALCWFTLGAMVFFGAVIAPSVFQRLDQESAGRFLRTVFPRLYLFCGLTTLFSAIGFGASTIIRPAVGLLIIALLFFVSRGPLTRMINEARDDELAGVEGAKAKFDRLHALSVRLFGSQALLILVCALYVIIR